MNNLIPIPRRKRKGIIILSLIVLIVIFGILVFPHFQEKPTISREQAIAKVRTHIEYLQCENVRAELRPPTEEEIDYLEHHGKEPPDLLWFIEGFNVKDSWIQVLMRALVNAYTGEVLDVTYFW